MPGDSCSMSGLKLDHAMVMVRDLRAASDDFARLGFRVLSGGRFPVGIENAIIPFGVHGPYLELVSVYRPGSSQIQDNEEFLVQGEGAMYVGLEVTSAAEVAKRLRGVGLEIGGPTSETIQPEGGHEAPLALWHTVTIQHGASPRSDPLFFTEYNTARRTEWWKRQEERGVAQPNGAQSFSSAWLAVDDFDEALVRYEALGLRRVRELQLDWLQSRAVELALDRGSLLLLEGTSPDGPLAALLALHESKIELPGVSLEVSSVDSALTSMSPDLARMLEPSAGPWGRNVVIPPELGHGMWVELFERPGRTRVVSSLPTHS
ncbi:MAG TPA: VOC family protein [Thermoplasmata archaeon]|nr:VOC family protein [Thermoplasmata archaeon]